MHGILTCFLLPATETLTTLEPNIAKGAFVNELKALTTILTVVDLGTPILNLVACWLRRGKRNKGHKAKKNRVEVHV